VADGYRDRRVIVFDLTRAPTSACGAPTARSRPTPLGSESVEGNTTRPSRSKQFCQHALCDDESAIACCMCATGSTTGFQVFNTDGTFVREGLVAPDSKGVGSAHALGFSAGQRPALVYVGDGASKKVWILQRDDLKSSVFWSRRPRGGQFGVVHALVWTRRGMCYSRAVVNKPTSEIQVTECVGRPLSDGAERDTLLVGRPPYRQRCVANKRRKAHDPRRSEGTAFAGHLPNSKRARLLTPYFAALPDTSSPVSARRLKWAVSYAMRRAARKRYR